MPTWNETRVRVEGLWNRSASVLPARTEPNLSGDAFISDAMRKTSETSSDVRSRMEIRCFGSIESSFRRFQDRSSPRLNRMKSEFRSSTKRLSSFGETGCAGLSQERGETRRASEVELPERDGGCEIGKDVEDSRGGLRGGSTARWRGQSAPGRESETMVRAQWSAAFLRTNIPARGWDRFETTFPVAGPRRAIGEETLLRPANRDALVGKERRSLVLREAPRASIFPSPECPANTNPRFETMAPQAWKRTVSRSANAGTRRSCSRG